MRTHLPLALLITALAAPTSLGALWSSGHGDIGIAYDAATDEWEPHFAFHEEEDEHGHEEEDEHGHEDEDEHGHEDEDEDEHGHPVIDGAEPTKEEYEIGELTINVLGPPQPGAGLAFSGASSVFLLPEDELQAEMLGNPWPGIAVEEIDTGIFVNDLVTLSLQGISGPGEFSFWNSDPFGGNNVLMSSVAGSGAPNEVDLLLDPGHFHFNVGFSEPGDYQVTFRASGELVAGGETGTDFVVNYRVAPEPSSLVLVLLGFSVFLRRRR